jgi:hypothetical protein
LQDLSGELAAARRDLAAAEIRGRLLLEQVAALEAAAATATVAKAHSPPQVSIAELQRVREQADAARAEWEAQSNQVKRDLERSQRALQDATWKCEQQERELMQFSSRCASADQMTATLIKQSEVSFFRITTLSTCLLFEVHA